MSRIVAMVDENAMAMFTDGAGTDTAARMQWVGSEVLLMPEWPGVVAVRGPSQFLRALRTHWGVEVPSFAHPRIVRMCPLNCRKIRPTIDRHAGDAAGW